MHRRGSFITSRIRNWWDKPKNILKKPLADTKVITPWSSSVFAWKQVTQNVSLIWKTLVSFTLISSSWCFLSHEFEIFATKFVDSTRQSTSLHLIYIELYNSFVVHSHRGLKPIKFYRLLIPGSNFYVKYFYDKGA